MLFSLYVLLVYIPTQCSIGNKVVRFRIPNVDRRFTVHEDLVCRTSAFFKSRLQTNRKALTDTDECCVCAEGLNSTFKDITFCVECGQNVHESCIESWKRSPVHSGSEKPAPTCPMCRALWKNEPLLKYLSVEDDLDVDGVQGYLDWLYSGSLRIDRSISPKTDDFNLFLLKSWAVAAAVKDDDFTAEIIAMFFAEARARFWTASVTWAFVERKGNDDIRNFIILVFMVYVEPGWFKKEAARWLDAFVRELADVAMVTWGGRKTFEELKKEWLQKMKLRIDSDIVKPGEVDNDVTISTGVKRPSSSHSRTSNQRKAKNTRSFDHRFRPSGQQTSEYTRVTMGNMSHIPTSDDYEDEGLMQQFLDGGH